MLRFRTVVRSSGGGKEGGGKRGRLFADVWLPLIFGLLFLGNPFPASAISAEQPPPASGGAKEYLVGVGDVLEVSVWGEERLSKTVFVRLDGRISLPLVGDVAAADTTLVSLAEQIKKRLVAFVADPSVTVTLQESRSKAYYVLGQIARPGEYMLNYPVTVLQAIARAGGLLEWAKKEKIMIVRRSPSGERIIPFNYEDVLAGENLPQNVQVVPGDTIVIP
ncbi:polysaccharide biosynthesis/export family protein [Thiovibrio sp. JS02]